MRCVLMTMLCAAAATGRESGQGARQLYENDILPPRAPTLSESSCRVRLRGGGKCRVPVTQACEHSTVRYFQVAAVLTTKMPHRYLLIYCELR